MVPTDLCRVEKMVFAKSPKAVDRSTIVVNSNVRLAGVPAEVFRLRHTST